MEHSEKEILEKRKNQVTDFLKNKKNYFTYLILTAIVFIGIFIRTRNISKLKDITTGAWTLGPDLDPWLFLRWAEYIVDHGKLMAWDWMRGVPFGFDTAREMKLLSYLIAWLHKFLSIFSNEITVTYSAIIFPIVMFALTTIAFFLFARKIFYKQNKSTKNIIALISTALFVTVPSLLPRTIAGIPEKESAAFFFMFIAFYFFLEAFTQKKFKHQLIFSILAGIFTAGMGLIWGGVLFLYLTIPLAIFISFLLKKIDLKKYIIYATWLITSFILMIPFSTKYTIKNLIASFTTGSAIAILLIIGISMILSDKKTPLEKIRQKTKLSKEIFYSIFSIIIIFFLTLIFLGPDMIIAYIAKIKSSLIEPSVNRFSFTVAENKQPFFKNDWKNSFGPTISNIPLFFWSFILGAIALFASLIKRIKLKNKIILISSYTIFLIFLIFSRYAANSILNGKSFLSLLMYFSGWLILLIACGYSYYQEKDKNIFKELEFSYILYLILLTLGVIGARGGIRLLLGLGAIAPIAIAFLTVKIPLYYFKQKEDTAKLIIGILAILIILSTLFTFYAYYKSDKITAENFAPGLYNQQWQKAMQWVRENTEKPTITAEGYSGPVFAHWWDYGYWIQGIGQRATVLDGGNFRLYWNHLMGRHVLTGTNETTALEFLYAHNTTHLLIDSTEIGKYTAYSSIGADENYDRFSWIQTFSMQEEQTQETQEETIHVYSGASETDEDIIWNNGEKEIIFPERKAVIGAIIIRKDLQENFKQPEAVFFYKNTQYKIPLRYIYTQNKKYEFEGGIEAGIFIYPSLGLVQNDQVKINPEGALFYLSEKTVNSQLAKLYLYGQETESFKLAHSEDSLIIESLKLQGLDIGDFVYYQGFQGPIKIWEISYPKGIELKQEFLELSYPDENLTIAQEGKYN